MKACLAKAGSFAMAINGAGTIARRFAVGGVALSCALLFILQMHSWPHPFALTLEMETERATRFYLLYDVPPDAAAPETVPGLLIKVALSALE